MTYLHSATGLNAMNKRKNTAENNVIEWAIIGALTRRLLQTEYLCFKISLYIAMHSWRQSSIKQATPIYNAANSALEHSIYG